MGRSPLALLCALVCCLLAASVLSVLGDNADGEAFMEEYRARDGVDVLESGVMVRVVKSSTDPTAKAPALDTPCEVHYVGKLVDGTVFDSSRERGQPAMFAPKDVIKGWTEVLQQMQEGDLWEVVIPSDLAYGSSGSGVIPAASTLVFEIELLVVDPTFTGFAAVKQFFMQQVPFAPFKLQIWQAVLLCFYVFVRVYLSSWFKSGPARAAAPAPAPAPAPAAADAKNKKTK